MSDTERSSGPTYGDLQRMVTDAIREMISGTFGDDSPYGYYAYVQDMTDDVVIFTSGGDMFEAPYTIDGGNNVTIGQPVPVVQVTTYEPVEANALGRPSMEFRSATAPPATRVRVRSEPLTYERHAPRSFFRDLAMRTMDAGANARMERHLIEVRANPDRTFGQGGYFSPPAWLGQKFATAKRPQRVLSTLIDQAGGRFPMPANVQSINLPRLTTGTGEQPQPDLEGEVDTDIVDAAVTSPVTDITGQADVSLQDLEQSPASAALDWAIFKDLTDAYDAQLEVALLFGTGTGGTFLGLTNIVGINAVTFTTATPFFSSSAAAANNLYPYIGQASAQIGDARDQPPEALLMRSARWSWCATSVDEQQRPIVPPSLQPPETEHPDGGVFPVSSFYGWPLYIDEALPATLGTGANQDLIIWCLPSDLFLWEGEPKTGVLLEVLSGTLSARIQLRAYAAAILGRYPTGIATIGGTGLIVASGF